MFNMLAKDRMRDSLIVAAIVIIGAYVGGLLLNLLRGLTPLSEGSGQIAIIVLLSLVLLGLGLVLWRSDVEPLAPL